MTIKEKNGHKPTRTIKSAGIKSKQNQLRTKEASANPSKEQRFKERWSQLNNDVHSALSHWNDLAQKYNGKVSRDDEHLHEIKVLLKELQSKLKIFNE